MHGVWLYEDQVTDSQRTFEKSINSTPLTPPLSMFLLQFSIKKRRQSGVLNPFRKPH